MKKEYEVTFAVREGRGNKEQKEEETYVKRFEAMPSTVGQVIQKVGTPTVNIRIW